MSTRKGLQLCKILPIILFFLSTSCTSLKQWAYEGNVRDEWQHPEQVIKALKIRPGDHIADLGSGSGYFTFRLADAAGSTGKVYAAGGAAELLGLKPTTLLSRIKKMGIVRSGH